MAAEEAAAVVVLARCRVLHLVLLRLRVPLNCCCCRLWPLTVLVCLLLPGAAG